MIIQVFTWLMRHDDICMIVVILIVIPSASFAMIIDDMVSWRAYSCLKAKRR